MRTITMVVALLGASAGAGTGNEEPIEVRAPRELRESCESLKKNARFEAYFDRVELEKLVQTVSDATCKTFILGENVKGKISLIGPNDPSRTSMTADQFYAAFLAALDANGFTVTTQGRFVRVVEKAKAKGGPIPLLDESEAFPARDEMVTRVFHTHHVELEPLKALLAQFVSPGASEVVAFPPDTLIVSDLGANQERLAKLMSLLDVPHPPTDELRLIPIQHADASTLVDEIGRVLSAKGPKLTEPFALSADERTNQLIAQASAVQMAQILDLVARLDLPLANSGRAHVYKLINTEAKDLATTLEALVGGGKTAKPAGANPASAPATVNTGEVKISADEQLNALVIVANTGDYRNLAAIIRELDVPRRQVFIETAIMEVNAERDSAFGVSLHGVATPGGLPVVIGSEPSGAASSLSLSSLASSSGLLFGLQGSTVTALSKALGITIAQFGLAVSASVTTSDVNVISTPHILTTDNHEAVITVGQKVPFQLGANPSQLASLLSTGNAATASTLASFGTNISREKVELKLTVKPHIGDGDQVRLEVDQQEEELAGENSLGPITSTRGQKTVVVARDDETVVLGGIMQDRIIESASKTPLLGDLPILGHLFRYETKKKVKVNLLVYLTPHVIREPGDVDRVLQRKAEERRRVLELVYGGSETLDDPPPDYGRKRGPLAAIAKVLKTEEERPENGGSGSPGEKVVEPRPAPAGIQPVSTGVDASEW